MILAFIFQTQKMKFFEKIYKYVPALLLCYFIPSIFNSMGIVSGAQSKLYFVVTRYLLPTALVLLTLSIDLRKVVQLGPKAIIMFLTGTAGIVIGGPFAVIIFSYLSPDTIGVEGPDAVWRGLATVAGSWIGGGANQTAMKEIFEVPGSLFSAVLAVDILVASVWMGIILYGAGISARVDRWFQADSSSIEDLKVKVETFQKKVARIPNLSDLMIIVGFGFGATAISHMVADIVAPFLGKHADIFVPYFGEYGEFVNLKRLSLTNKFFWLIVCATTFGLMLSFTKARNFEGAGASKVGSVFIYVLVATIGMEMDVMAVFRTPGVFAVGAIWISFHAVLLIAVGKLIRAPFFFLAVGSQANIGGAASAPVVASAFHPALAPVGVLLAVLGYALGTYCAYLCGILMQWATPVATLAGG
ncbi:MAG: hypothetical protein CL798_09520 [Chromatiales bacterium]|nr:hypothetical protein [Chromatiales bacterium]